MTIKQVQRAASLRGIYFTGEKKWLNTQVGYGYEFFTPNGTGFRQSDTLAGAYKQIMEFDKIKED